LPEVRVGQHWISGLLTFQAVQNSQGLKELQLAVVAEVATVTARRSSNRHSERIEFSGLQTVAEQVGPNTSCRRPEIKRRRRDAIVMLPASGPEPDDGHCGSDALDGRRTGARQDPDVAQAVVIRVPIAQSVAQDTEQRDLLILRFGAGSRKMSEQSDQLCSTIHRLSFEKIRRCRRLS
jgi:hypothetical protein